MSVERPTRRSARLMGQKLLSTRPEHFGNLGRVPTEIRLKILEAVLVSPERLSFTRTWLPPSKRKRPSDHGNKFAFYDDISPVLRLCRLNKTENGEPIALALHADFVNFCLVSKQMREEAMSVFFGRNKWVLHVAAEINSIEWIVKKWGEESLRRIKVMRIHLQSVGYRRDWLIFKELEQFVNVVKKGAQLHTLSVHWKHAYRYIQSAAYVNSIPHVRWLGKTSRCARKSTRVRNISCISEDESNSDNGQTSASDRWYESLAAREVIMMPLLELKRVNTSIEGAVTERWALWLESCMSADKGGNMAVFDMTESARQSLQNLKKATSPEEYFQMMIEADPEL